VTAAAFKAMAKIAKGATAKTTDAGTGAAKQSFVLLKRIAGGNFTGINPNIIHILINACTLTQESQFTFGSPGSSAVHYGFL
jgi:hypothetical protein